MSYGARCVPSLTRFRSCLYTCTASETSRSAAAAPARARDRLGAASGPAPATEETSMPAAPCPRNHELRKTWYAQYAASAGDLVAAEICARMSATDAAGDLESSWRHAFQKRTDGASRKCSRSTSAGVRAGKNSSSSSGRFASVSGRPIQPSTGALSVAGDATVPEWREKRPAGAAARSLRAWRNISVCTGCDVSSIPERSPWRHVSGRTARLRQYFYNEQSSHREEKRRDYVPDAFRDRRPCVTQVPPERDDPADVRARGDPQRVGKRRPAAFVLAQRVQRERHGNLRLVDVRRQEPLRVSVVPHHERVVHAHVRAAGADGRRETRLQKRPERGREERVPQRQKGGNLVHRQVRRRHRVVSRGGPPASRRRRRLR
mmetsp:Transcript_6987/g.28726  ORF Transcript_6987/g.28726 Transcript_6987/m.28726 type:complete len:376 (-) Transcript_6987:1172-2299(-)